MKPFNYLFYIVLFFGFFLPTNTELFINLGGVSFYIREFSFILLPVINRFCFSRNDQKTYDRKLQVQIAFFISIVFFTEIVLKLIIFNQGLGGAFKTLRLGLPLISCLLLLYTGIKANVKIVWKVLLWAIGASVILSLVSLIFPLPIYPEIEGNSVLDAFKGRLYNANASFGVIGLYFLLQTKYNNWYAKGKLVRVVSILSIISLVLTFNRTYIALLTIMFIFFSIRNFSARNIFKLISIPIIFIGVFFTAYNSSDLIKYQVDKRIFSIIYQKTTIAKSTINNTRSVIYEGVQKRIEEGGWIVGLPYHQEIFVWDTPWNQNTPMPITDTTFFNILLRYGIIPLLLFTIIFYRIGVKYKIPIVTGIFLVFLVASLNLDSLMRHNSILFFIILFFISNFNNNDQENSIYSKD